MTGDQTVQARTTRLLKYLQAVRALRERPVRHINGYRDMQRWIADIPDHPACVVTATGQTPWLRVEKASKPDPPPEMHPVLVEFVDGSIANPRHEPMLRPGLDVELADRPDDLAQLERGLRNYVEHEWRPWAEVACVAVAARELYDELYELRLRLQREESAIELVWGHGVLSWKVNDEIVLHPMVTTRMELDFDAGTGAISLVPESADARLEIDLLQGLGLHGFDLLVDVADSFRSDPVGPFDPNTRHLYERLLAPLGLDGRVSDAERHEPPGATPVITAGSVLLVRRRHTLYQRYFSILHDAVANGAPVPSPLAAVVADEPSVFDGGDADRWATVGERLLMPLPTNEEQEQVVRRLTQHRGVTVQGPPGTGKTHTIANLVSHLVGHGKRVLVTSQKEQALSVLQEKIPESIRDLSVAVLGNSAASLQQLDNSVQAIYEHAAGLDRERARVRIADLDDRLDAARRQVAELRTRIATSVDRERATFRLGEVGYTPSTLGRLLSEHRERLGFITDPIEATIPCPLTRSELEELYRLGGALEPTDCAHARRVLPAPEHLPSAEDLAATDRELAGVRDRLAATEDLITDRSALDRLGADGLRALAAEVAHVAERLGELEQPWLTAIRDEVRSGPSLRASWQGQVEAMTATIDGLTHHRNRLLGHRVELPGGGLPTKEQIGQLDELRRRFEAGKGVSKLLHRDLHQLREGCRVDEEPPRAVDDVDLCLAQAQSLRQRYELMNRWNDAVTTAGGPRVKANEARPEAVLHDYVGALRDAVSWETGAWDGLRSRLVVAGASVPTHATADELRAVAAGLTAAGDHYTEQLLAARLAGVRKYLEDGAANGDAAPSWRDLLAAFDASDWPRWAAALDEVRRIWSLTSAVVRLDELTERLRAVAPNWATAILAHRGDGTAGQAEVANEAWAWRQADTWLEHVVRAEDPAVLQSQLEEQQRIVARLTGDLTAASAWLSLAERLTDAERSALSAWAQALKKVGKGTGKYAAKWRGVAQREMAQAQSAVPVWIMPAHRVVESFDPAAAHFDVVIVDESSQCDIFALAALGLADKAIVVGDDKQISPAAVGTDQSKVHDLISQHIAQLPHAELLDVTSSLYDIAKRTFPGVIMLREHFRCLPEIIEFSNDLSYGGKILPLREPATDPTWQPVVDVHVPDGYREPGTDANPPEAGFIVDKIAELCADARYDGKTFGVISMLGGGQAELIERKLIERLGEREMEQRRIRCGDAYHFQGDERDVMFVSLVVAAGEGSRIGAMTKDSDRQRMNVAASRARDQLWCVRSVLADELSVNDVRAQFIGHCQNPERVAEELGDLADRCESEFERDVLRRLVARGYRVRPQHPVGRFRIDLVVNGTTKRLAVELDGDAYHGPDQWKDDRNRQAILERLGWTFHRVRGSAFYRDPEEALRGLWDRLDALGIYPAGDERNATPAPTPAAPSPEPSPAEPEPATGSSSNGRTPTRPPAPAVAVERPRAEAPASDDRSAAPKATAAVDPASNGSAPTSGNGHAPPPAAAPAEPRPTARTHRRSTAVEQLAPFIPWTRRPLPDIERTPRSTVIDTIEEIVAAEGPVLAARVYDLYVKASGADHLSGNARQELNRATAAAVREARITQIKDSEPGQITKTLHMPGTPPVVLRTRGARRFEHIPATEITALAGTILDDEPDITDDELTGLILNAYDRTTLDDAATIRLTRCIKAARGPVSAWASSRAR
ncbi:MAG: AAA domain-containing protein [Actinomycetota bacterium]|nr:AAA domain-containing protein [Actinomycetota bacterium]